MSFYRTRTYIAGEWDGDRNLISQLYAWNDNDNLQLTFSDAHSLMQARDSSLPCSIKKSLAQRLDASKTFLLVVGDKTTSVTKGSCQYCEFYRYLSCQKNHFSETKSFIQFECDKALRDNLHIIVVYNSDRIDRGKCPSELRYVGKHIKGYYIGLDGRRHLNYQEIKNAILSY